MSIELLEIAINGFVVELADVRADQWNTQTVCDDWDVTRLVRHLVNGALMSEMVLHGGTKDAAIAFMDNHEEEPVNANDVATSGAAHVAAFREPGALENIVTHPAMDMPGAQLLMFRIGDYLLHTWDLCASLGKPVVLDSDCVQFMWTALEPMAAVISSFGVFGEGPSGTVGADASLQDRLVDLTGRRRS